MKDEDATQVIDLINQLYRKEHLIGKEWSPDKRLRYRKEYAPPILKQIKTKLLEIQSKPTTLPKSPLSMAVNYMLHEYDALCNYIKNADYKLDNNAIELCMRYISLSRKNSLFCGSHAGAKRSALIYSLACSCRLHGINTFEYFTDVLNRYPMFGCCNTIDVNFREWLIFFLENVHKYDLDYSKDLAELLPQNFKIKTEETITTAS